MKLLLAFSISLTLLAQSCADSSFLDRSRKDQSILQGFNVDPQSVFAKSMVLITQDLVFEKNQPFFFGVCTGLIISKRAVLTAAHCLNDGHKDMKIIFNPTPRKNLKADEIYSVITSAVHKSYEMKGFSKYPPDAPESFEETFGYSDIAVLMVDRDFEAVKAAPYTFISPMHDHTPEKAVIAGFGKTTVLKDTEKFDYKSVNGSLRQATVQLRKESFINGRILLSQRNEPGVCKGDSGAPLFIYENGTLKPFAMAIGVFSKISSLDPDLSVAPLENGCSYYGVYLLLEPLQNWILTTEKTLRKNIETLDNSF